MHRDLERDIDEKKTTLGEYIDYAEEDDIVDQHLVDEQDSTLWALNRHRTKLVHDDGYWASTYSNPEIRENVINIINEILDFLDK